MTTNNSEIALITGLKDTLNLKVEDVKVWDWAWGLNHTPRWSGATPVFWSVLSHTGLVRQLAFQGEKGQVNPVDELGILIHDASEALGFSDLPTPIKQDPSFAFYRESEQRVLDTIFARFGLKREDFNWELIKRYDQQALYIEWCKFFGHFRGHRSEIRPAYPIEVSKIGPLVVAKPLDYVEHLRHLTINLALTYNIPDINDLFLMPETLAAYVRPPEDTRDLPIIDADVLELGV